MTYSPKLIAMVHKSFPDDEIVDRWVSMGDLRLQSLLHEIRPGPDAVILAEAIIEQGASPDVLECANAVIHRLVMSDLCNQEVLQYSKSQSL